MFELGFDFWFKVSGAIGLILITGGVLAKKRINATMLFIAGGVFLEAYSLYIQDIIFIVLQIIFIIVSIYEFFKLKSSKKTI